jgi:outer membrane protein assembly factor BamD (BamD/ComL family)
MTKALYQANPLSLPLLGRRLSCLALVLFSLVLSSSALAQDTALVEKSESNIELLIKAQADIQELKKGALRTRDLAYGAERNLKTILQRDPDSPLRFQVLEDLKQVQEILGQHSLLIADFFMSHGHGHSSKGAEFRLLQIVREYPAFSKTDEVLFRLATLTFEDERPDDATRYLWKLVCNYPNSPYSKSAFEQLNGIGFRLWEGCDKFKL